jgi:hypothetical protein
LFTKNLEGMYPEVVDGLVKDLAKALHDGRTTSGEKQSNDGWPYQDKATKNEYPQLNEK